MAESNEDVQLPEVVNTQKSNWKDRIGNLFKVKRNPVVVLTPTVQNDQKGLSRRDFLKVAAVTGAGAVATVYEVDRRVQNLAEFLQKLEPLEEVAFTADMHDEVPQVLQDVEMPNNNARYRPPQKIVQEALDIYNKWQEQNPQLPKLHWRKPDNYLSYIRLASNFAQKTIDNKYSSGPLDLRNNLYWAADDNDKPYSNFIRFGWMAISSLGDLIYYEPGSGIVRKAIDKLKGLEGNRGSDSSPKIEKGMFSDQDRTLFTEEIKTSIDDAVSYTREQGKGNPVSTSLLLAYFLHQNKGDISKGFWDTTVFLKLLSRNNLSDLKYQPTREAADLLASLFLDEFSPEVSFNWLANHVPASEAELNNPKEKRFKNYQPINRVGSLYHAWNIISWSTCMPPNLAMNITRSYFIQKEDYRIQHGKEKVKTDIRVAASVRDVAKLIGQYESR